MPNLTDLATAAGFTTAASEAQKQQLLAGRMAQAYEFYRFVTPEQVAAFNSRLKEQTIKRTGKTGSNLREHYDVLAFTPAEKYATMPPADVLQKVAEAKARGIFDTFEVAQIESVVEYKDPIVFGVIAGCGDRFFIGQWDSDVSIDDLLGPNEG